MLFRAPPRDQRYHLIGDISAAPLYLLQEIRSSPQHVKNPGEYMGSTSVTVGMVVSWDLTSDQQLEYTSTSNH